MDISLVFPFRDRMDDLGNLCESLRKTTKDKTRVEMVLVVDKCDQKVAPFVNNIMGHYDDLNMKILVVDRSDHHSKDYYNRAAKASTGRWIFVINDDSLFMTDGWDEIIHTRMSEKANETKDDILFGIVNDGMTVKGQEAQKRTFSCFPLLTREYCDLMDGVLLEEIYTWGGDYWLGQIFSDPILKTRRVYLQDVLVDHNSHHNQKPGKVQGPNFGNFQRIERENPSTFNGKKLEEKVSFIKRYIKDKHRK